MRVYPKELLQEIERLKRIADFSTVERLLNVELKMAKEENKKDFVLSELAELYCTWVPPQWEKALEVSAERESLSESAYSKLRTAMILEYGLKDHLAAIQKLISTAAAARQEGDENTLYSALSLLGRAALALGETQKSLSVLDEIEALVRKKAKIVIGDETSFLEEMYARGIERNRVCRLAGHIAQICSEPEFRKRLERLSLSGS